jgi:hypothetical protein
MFFSNLPRESHTTYHPPSPRDVNTVIQEQPHHLHVGITKSDRLILICVDGETRGIESQLPPGCELFEQ